MHTNCYKIIGYPADYKPRMKFGNNTANNVTVEEHSRMDFGGNNSSTTIAAGVPTPYFTPAQYNQIL